MMMMMFFVNVVIFFVSLINVIAYYLRQHQEKDYDREKKSSSSVLFDQYPCRCFSLREIKSATRNFDEALVVGKGGFGKVYKGIIDNGASIVAIKRLDFGSKQGAPQFRAEIEMLSKFRHGHLVSLIGYCNQNDEMIIVYQYMAGGSLEAWLHKHHRLRGDNNSSLSWVQRLKVCIGAARGLNYLHTGTSIQDRVIHRDVKSSNILLDENMEAKISDFGLSKIGPANQTCTHVSTHVIGTRGYLDPDYILTRRVTRKSDVYAFGVVLLETLCGRPAVNLRVDEEQWGLALWAKQCIKEGRLIEIVDPNIQGSIISKCLKVFADIAEQCLHNNSKRRPTMAEVVTRLEYALELQEGNDSYGVDADIISDTDGYGNQQDADLSTETEASNGGGGMSTEGEVINAGNEQVVESMQLGDSSRSQPNIKSVKKRSFMKKVRLFFSTTAQVFSAEDIRLGQLKRYSFRELEVATLKFSDTRYLGGGGFGNVYRGCLVDGSLVAVRRLNKELTQFTELQFQTEVEKLGMAMHRNVLQLRGFCITPTERLLVYPYMANNSVASYLSERTGWRPPLSWQTRKQIALGSARGLAYLHDDCVPRIIHRNVKAANMLLDEEFKVVIGHFGLAKFMDNSDTHVTTDVMGTYGYIAPEYFSTGQCLQKTDVYGYGVMLLELITGRKANDPDVMLVYWANELVRQRNFAAMVAADLEGNSAAEEVEPLVQLALLCTQSLPTKRPKMSEVVRMLHGDGLAERWDQWQNEEAEFLSHTTEEFAYHTD